MTANSKTTKPEPRVVTIEEAAKILRISRVSAYQAANCGDSHNPHRPSKAGANGGAQSPARMPRP